MPEQTTEFQTYAQEFLNSALKAQSRLPVRAQDQLTPGFWQSWRYEVQIVNSEIRQWRPAR
jgi:hypothetical protein